MNKELQLRQKLIAENVMALAVCVNSIPLNFDDKEVAAVFDKLDTITDIAVAEMYVFLQEYLKARAESELLKNMVNPPKSSYYCDRVNNNRKVNRGQNNAH